VSISIRPHQLQQLITDSYTNNSDLTSALELKDIIAQYVIASSGDNLIEIDWDRLFSRENWDAIKNCLETCYKERQFFDYVIRNHLHDYVILIHPEISREERQEQYDEDYVLREQFLKSPELYQAYLQAILKRDYYVSTEEILILISISNRWIILKSGDHGNLQLYEVDQAIREGYLAYQETQSNPFEWPEAKEDILPVYHQGRHYSRGKDSILAEYQAQTGEKEKVTSSEDARKSEAQTNDPCSKPADTESNPADLAGIEEADKAQAIIKSNYAHALAQKQQPETDSLKVDDDSMNYVNDAAEDTDDQSSSDAGEDTEETTAPGVALTIGGQILQSQENTNSNHPDLGS